MTVEHVGAVLAEQQAVIALLINRFWLTDPRSPGDAETLSRALYSHLVMLEQTLQPAFHVAEQANTIQATVRLVAGQLATAVSQLQDSGSFFAYEELKISIPMLFASELLLVRSTPRGDVIDQDLAQRMDDQFTALMGTSDLQEMRVLLSSLPLEHQI